MQQEETFLHSVQHLLPYSETITRCAIDHIRLRRNTRSRNCCNRILHLSWMWNIPILPLSHSQTLMTENVELNSLFSISFSRNAEHKNHSASPKTHDHHHDNKLKPITKKKTDFEFDNAVTKNIYKQSVPKRINTQYPSYTQLVNYALKIETFI